MDDRLRRAIAAMVRRTTDEQEVPERLEDASLIVKVGRILRRSHDERRDGRP